MAAPATKDGAKIVLSVHHGFSIRYLLQTDIFATLRESDARLIVLSLSDAEHLRGKFGDSGVEFVQIPPSIGEHADRRGALQRLLRFIRAYTHARRVRTTEHTLAIALKDAALTNPSWRTRFNLLLMRLMISCMRNIRPLRRAVLRFEERVFGADEYVAFLRDMRPDLVVTTSLGTFDFDQYVLRAARKLRLPTAVVVLSWDNTTTRGYPGATADHVIAWSEIMKWELDALNDVPERTVSVEGVAHFDHYFRPDPDYDRTAFLSSLGLDPEKRTILVATKSPNCYAQNPNIAEIIALAIEDGRLPPDCQVLVRVHPLHYRFRNGRLLYEDVLAVYRRLAEEHPSIRLNEPVITSQSVNYDMATQEILFLSRLLRSTDVLVNFFSTMNIEAAIFDVPMVNVNFDDLPPLYPCERGHRYDIRIDYESDHNQRIVESGGTQIANDPQQMITQIESYLADPTLDRDGRKRIVDREVGPNRGNAGKAIAARILGLVEQPH